MDQTHICVLSADTNAMYYFIIALQQKTQQTRKHVKIIKNCILYYIVDNNNDAFGLSKIPR